MKLSTRRAFAFLVGACLWTGMVFAAETNLPLQPIIRNRSEVAAVLARAPRPDASVASKPMTIVLVADIKDHLGDVRAHDYPRWQERWARLIGGSAARGRGPVNLYGETAAEATETPGAPGVRVIAAQQWPSQEQFDAADVIVAFCYIKWDTQRLEQLQHYLARGKGYAAIHSATWTKPKPLAALGAITGVGGFQFYRHGIVKLQIDQPNHPICFGLPREIEMRDETYWPATPEPDLPGYTVLASSSEQIKPGTEGTKPQVIFWTAQPGAGRVFGCVLGHFTWTFDDPFFRTLLLRGIAWAGGTSPYRFDPLITTHW